MVSLSISLLLLAFLCAVLGFTGGPAGVAGIAKICCAIFLALFLISAFFSTSRGRTSV